MKSYSFHLNCPRFLNINTSRSFFETASVLNKTLSQSDPDAFRTIIFDRDVGYMKNFWNVRDTNKSGSLSKEDTIQVLRSVIDTHWKDEQQGLTPDEKYHFALTFCNLAEQHGGGDGTISLDSLISAFKIYTGGYVITFYLLFSLLLSSS